MYQRYQNRALLVWPGPGLTWIIAAMISGRPRRKQAPNCAAKTVDASSAAARRSNPALPCSGNRFLPTPPVGIDAFEPTLDLARESLEPKCYAGLLNDLP